MAVIGLSKPYIATYSNNGTTVTYETAALLGKAVSLELSLDGGSDNTLYADNAPVETDNQFAGGSLTITTDDIDAATFKTILGLVEENAVGGSALETGTKWEVFNDSQATPYMGFGGIVKKKVGGSIKYVAVAFDKIQFQNPAMSVNTQGDSIEWQTNELTATLMRSDNASHSWRRLSTPCETEAGAEAALLGFFNPPA